MAAENPQVPAGNHRSRNWMITVFPDAQGDYNTTPFNFVASNGSYSASEWKTKGAIRVVKYAAGTTEICPSTNKEHMHIVFQLSEPCDFTTLKKAMDNRTHIEAMQGTIEQATTYCSKEETRKPGTQPWQVPFCCNFESPHWIHETIEWTGNNPCTQSVLAVPF